MSYIIPAIIALLFGIAFFGWGLYQVKTGKMVAKRRRYTVDEPREVGVVFIYLGILGFILSANLFVNSTICNISDSVRQIISLSCLMIGLIGPLILIITGIYDLKKHRIFTIKTTTKTRHKIKKYYKIVGVSSISTGLIIPVAIMTTFISSISFIITGILFITGTFACFTMAFFISKIELSIKNS